MHSDAHTKNMTENFVMANGTIEKHTNLQKALIDISDAG